MSSTNSKRTAKQDDKKPHKGKSPLKKSPKVLTLAVSTGKPANQAIAEEVGPDVFSLYFCKGGNKTNDSAFLWPSLKEIKESSELKKKFGIIDLVPRKGPDGETALRSGNYVWWQFLICAKEKGTIEERRDHRQTVATDICQLISDQANNTDMYMSSPGPTEFFSDVTQNSLRAASAVLLDRHVAMV